MPGEKQIFLSENLLLFFYCLCFAKNISEDTPLNNFTFILVGFP